MFRVKQSMMRVTFSSRGIASLLVSTTNTQRPAATCAESVVSVTRQITGRGVYAPDLPSCETTPQLRSAPHLPDRSTCNALATLPE